MRTRKFAVYIAAGRDEVWRALTDPALTCRYYFGLSVDSDWRPGSPIAYRSAPAGEPGPALVGEILYVEPARTLMHSLLDDAGPDPTAQCWITWELDEREPGTCLTRLTCEDVDPDADPERDDAWCRLISWLKTTVETQSVRAKFRSS